MPPPPAGKSTIIDYMRNFFDAEDVGVIGNNFERVFGFSPLIKKRIVIGPEVRSDLVKSVDQAQLQSVISGELSSYAVKHGDPIVATFPAQLLFGGNQDMGFSDEAGSIARRFLVMDFLTQITTVDTELSSKLEQERPLWLVKANRAYLTMVFDVKTDNVWSHLPARFGSSQNTLSEENNSLIHFLNNGNLVFGADKWIPERAFLKVYRAHCAAYKMTEMRWMRTTTASAFSIKKLTASRGFEVKDYRTWDNLRAKYILGVDAHEDVDVDVN